VLILADDLGINDLACYGRTDHRTPHLDRLASEGLRFSSACAAAPVCSPSRAALLTAQSPARLHLTTFLPGRPDTRAQMLLHPSIRMELPLREVTLAEALQKVGYTSACIGKWHLGGNNFGPEQRGFDIAFVGHANTTPSASEGGKGEYELTARAEQFLKENRDRPFFLYLAHNTPHIPLAAGTRFVANNRSAFNPLYAAVVETLDDSVGRVLARIDSLSLRNDTIVVFASDNGGLHVPEGGEDPPTHNTPYRAGKGFLYEGGLRVPLIIRWPGHVRPGALTDEPVINTDLMPTLLSLAGLEPTRPCDGRSFADLLSGRPGHMRTFFWHFPHYSNQGSRPGGAMREGEWKLIEHYEDGRLELFNLRDDMGETNDLAPRERRRAEAMRERLSAWRVATGAQMNVPNPDFDPVLHRQLYLDTDVSRLAPAVRAREMTPKLASWRKGMDSVLPPKRGS
jgi:arylsulfatase A-like enzyme